MTIRRLSLITVVCLASMQAMAQSSTQPVQAPSGGVVTPGASVGSGLAPDASRSPYYIGIQQGISRETNKTESTQGTTRQGDFVSVTTLRAGVNQPVSRQRFFADAEVRYNAYSEHNDRNHYGYGLTGGVDWATIGNLAGNVTAHADRNMTSFVQSTLFGNLATNNIERSEELRGVARLGGASALNLEVGANYRQAANTATGLRFRDFKRLGANMAVNYRISPATSLGVGVGGARTDYPNWGADQSDRRDIYLQGQWTPTSASDFNFRLAKTTMEYDINTPMNYSGVTGSLTWGWRPTAKVAVSTFLARDTGQDIGFLRLVPGQPVAAADLASVTDSLGIRASYEASSKILVDAGMSYQKRTLTNAFTGAYTTQRGSSNTTAVMLGARWLPTRNVTLGCQVTREQRNTSTYDLTNQADTTRATADSVGCYGAFTLY